MGSFETVGRSSSCGVESFLISVPEKSTVVKLKGNFKNIPNSGWLQKNEERVLRKNLVVSLEFIHLTENFEPHANAFSQEATRNLQR